MENGQGWFINLMWKIYLGLEMARKSRIHVAGGLYHVMLRGDGWELEEALG